MRSTEFQVTINPHKIGVHPDPLPGLRAATMVDTLANSSSINKTSMADLPTVEEEEAITTIKIWKKNLMGVLKEYIE